MKRHKILKILMVGLALCGSAGLAQAAWNDGAGEDAPYNRTVPPPQDASQSPSTNNPYPLNSGGAAGGSTISGVNSDVGGAGTQYHQNKDAPNKAN